MASLDKFKGMESTLGSVFATLENLHHRIAALEKLESQSLSGQCSQMSSTPSYKPLSHTPARAIYGECIDRPR
jgi:hypothetical protein